MTPVVLVCQTGKPKLLIFPSHHTKKINNSRKENIEEMVLINESITDSMKNELHESLQMARECALLSNYDGSMMYYQTILQLLKK